MIHSFQQQWDQARDSAAEWMDKPDRSEISTIIDICLTMITDWIGLCSVLRPLQHSIGYTGDGFYRSKDPTNSIKVLKENLQRKTTQRT